MDDFDFDEGDEGEQSPESLAEQDLAYMESLTNQHDKYTCEQDADWFNYWFLIALLLMFVFVFATVALVLVYGKRKRDTLTSVTVVSSMKSKQR